MVLLVISDISCIQKARTTLNLMLSVHIIVETFYSYLCRFVMMQVQLEVINKSTMNSDFDTLVLNGLRSLSLSGQALPGRDQPP